VPNPPQSIEKTDFITYSHYNKSLKYQKVPVMIVTPGAAGRKFLLPRKPEIRIINGLLIIPPGPL
jgi:hypothetical protein